MKRIIYFFLILPLLAACFEDKGSYDYTDPRPIEISGIDSVYICNLSEMLDITPRLSENITDAEYDYMWMCYDKDNLRKKIDTLSTQKHLSYKMNLPLSSYRLIFACRHKQTRVTKYTYSSLVVQSSFSRGWYVLKEIDGSTDLDLFIGSKKTANVLANVTGQPLSGTPRYLGFTKYTWLNQETGELSDHNKCFTVLTSKDLSVIRISDMKRLAGFKDLFFETAPNCNPSLWFSGSEENGFVNDGALYTYTERNGELGLSKFAYPKDGGNAISSVFTKNATMSPLLFDLKLGRFCTSFKTPDNVIILKDEANSLYKNDFVGYEPVYFGFLDEGMWEGGKIYAVLRKQADRSHVIVYIDGKSLVYYEPSFLTNGITKIARLDAALMMNKANCFAQNRKFEMMYFGVNDKLYCYDLANALEYEVKREDGQSAIPVGEHITMMKHVVFDYQDYQDPNVKENVDRLAIVTNKGNTYKLYLFETVANKVKNAPIVYEGTGNPKQILYMSPYFGDVFVCY